MHEHQAAQEAELAWLGLGLGLGLRLGLGSLTLALALALTDGEVGVVDRLHALLADDAHADVPRLRTRGERPR